MMHALIEPRLVIGAPAPAPEAEPGGLALLAEIGVAAVSKGLGASARPIFALVDEAQPDNAAGAIGLSLIDLGEGREGDAIARLRQVIAARSRCRQEARAVLCLILTQTGRKAEAAALRKLVLRGPDGPARRMVGAFFAAGAPVF